MNLDTLIVILNDYREELGGDVEVRLMTQQNWPFENRVCGVTSGQEMNDTDDDDEGDDQDGQHHQHRTRGRRARAVPLQARLQRAMRFRPLFERIGLADVNIERAVGDQIEQPLCPGGAFSGLGSLTRLLVESKCFCGERGGLG